MWLTRYRLPQTLLTAQLLLTGCVDVLPATPDPIDREENDALDDGGAADASTGGSNGGNSNGTGGMDGGFTSGNGGSMDGGPPPDSDAGAGNGGGDDAGPTDDASTPRPVTLDCESYCETIQAACTGNFEQYLTLRECLAMCDDMPSGRLNASTGDTLGCRLYHAQTALRQGRADVNCPAAGPTGGDVCGSRCEALCDRSSKLCSEDRDYPEAYPSRDDCLTICEPTSNGVGGYAVDEVKELPAAGNTVNCRIYHLRNAYGNINEDDPVNDSASVHCRHVGRISPTCL